MMNQYENEGEEESKENQTVLGDEVAAESMTDFKNIGRSPIKSETIVNKMVKTESS